MTTVPNNVLQPAKVWKYSAGEVGVRVNPMLLDSDPDYLYPPSFHINSSDSLMAAVMFLNAARHAGTKYQEIVIPYLPYSRQDRIVHPGDPMALDVIANMFAEEGVTHITTYDVHSPASINIFAKHGIELVSKMPFASIQYLIPSTPGDNWIVVYPDHGSIARVNALAQATGIHKSITMDKKRDTATGQIVGYEIVEHSAGLNPELRYNVIVFDDICDGGRTFIEVAKQVKELLPQSRLILYVTHGIFSKGYDELNQYYDHIECFNSINPDEVL